MGSLSWIHWLLLALVALVLFGGRGKVSDLMGDFGRGVSSFKKGLNEGKEDPKVINAETASAEKPKDTVSR
jgi:sec-independent protein translocase protein TatA